MENREEKTLKTPLGKDLVVKAFLTFGERRAIRDAYNLASDADKARATEDALVAAVVVSYDGSGKETMIRLLSADEREAAFVLEACFALNQDPKKPRT